VRHGCTSPDAHRGTLRPWTWISRCGATSTGRRDGVSVGGSGPGTVSVVVHVVRGRLHELEVSAGEGVVVPLDALPGPTDVEVT
jgi:hypothetical protein